jgi:SUMO ligase MMS21 Smc5/6 complex component
LHRLDLALANAAILTLRHRLSASTTTLLPAAQKAYYHALHLLNQNSQLLTVSQKVKAETILAKILSTLNQ